MQLALRSAFPATCTYRAVLKGMFIGWIRQAERKRTSKVWVLLPASHLIAEAIYTSEIEAEAFSRSARAERYSFLPTLEPSIAAYHLAFGFDEYLYVAGPTTSSFDSIYRISPSTKYVTG